jgi:hypothetical protein
MRYNNISIFSILVSGFSVAVAGARFVAIFFFIIVIFEPGNVAGGRRHGKGRLLSRNVRKDAVLAISFGRFSMYSRSDDCAAAAARGQRWPV